MTFSNQFDELNARLGIAGVARVVAGKGGLAKVEISSPLASAEIYLLGAQVTSWRPEGGAEDAIFLSPTARFEVGKAIRGGIPICFPWFRGKAGDAKAPAHGFLRTREWELISLAAEGERVVATLAAEADEASRRWWPHEFRAEYRVSVGAELGLELTVINTGAESFRFEEALHTYFRVSDAGAIRITGLEGVGYLDNMDGNNEKRQVGAVVLSEPTDRAYMATEAAVEIVDGGRRLRTEKAGSRTTVVWNPWLEGAAALADLGDAWREMACVEASNILAEAVTLGPGERHVMAATVRVE